MCHTPASHWSLLPPTNSILCLSHLSLCVTLAQLVPRHSSFVSPGISTGMFSTCEHCGTRAHLLSSVLSHFHISISSVSSRSDSHAHCCGLRVNTVCSELWSLYFEQRLSFLAEWLLPCWTELHIQTRLPEKRLRTWSQARGRPDDWSTVWSPCCIRLNTPGARCQTRRKWLGSSCTRRHCHQESLRHVRRTRG